MAPGLDDDNGQRTRIRGPLTAKLADVRSPVRRFLDARFGSGLRDVQRRYREDAPGLVVPAADRQEVNPGTLGAAADWTGAEPATWHASNSASPHNQRISHQDPAQPQNHGSRAEAPGPSSLPITIGFTVVSLVIASRAERPIPHTESGTDGIGAAARRWLGHVR
jgi:hypothetical protein